jgi:hypothetical protein
MKKTIYILLLGLLTILFSCEKNGLFVICRDCFPEEPERAKIEVRLSAPTLSSGYFSAIINVYDGNLEDSILIHTDRVQGEEWTFTSYFNKKYTFTATYVNNTDTYITIGEAFPKVRLVNDQCEEPCYYVYANKVNLRLKYPEL